MQVYHKMLADIEKFFKITKGRIIITILLTLSSIIPFIIFIYGLDKIQVLNLVKYICIKFLNMKVGIFTGGKGAFMAYYLNRILFLLDVPYNYIISCILYWFYHRIRSAD